MNFTNFGLRPPTPLIFNNSLIERYNHIKNVFDSEECRSINIKPILPILIRVLSVDKELLDYILKSRERDRFIIAFQDVYNTVFVLNKYEYIHYHNKYEQFALQLLLNAYH